MRSAISHQAHSCATSTAGSVRIAVRGFAISLLGLWTVAAEIGVEGTPEIDFNESIRPLFNRHCVGCHGGVKKAGGISFLSRSSALGEAKSGERAIVPHEPKMSELLHRVVAEDLDERMPPPEHGPALTEKEVDTLRAWIDAGAPWKTHWAFEAPEKADPPEVKKEDWCHTPIDRFILSRLEAEGMKPNAPASKTALLRRLSFDLTGLPPTLDQLDRFLADDRPSAYEGLVDEMLESKGYGERWAAMWLDLARYADSEGLGVDARRDSWAYRDWVIAALQNNKPFDQFVIEQLAGDLLPNPSTDQLVATAFHRQTQSNGEGGTDDEEFRVAAVVDRTNATWEVFQGLTFGCVQCHSHPYDPIENLEYYEFLAYFNNTADADLGDHWPKLRVPLDRNDYGEAESLRRRIHEAEKAEHAAVRETLKTSTWFQPSASQVQASSQGNGVRMVEAHGEVEFRAEGNIAAGTEYAFETEAPGHLKTLTALRIDLMPVDEAAARHTPEWGGVLSRIRVEIKSSSSAEFEEVPLARVLGDEAHPSMSPDDSLKRGGSGFGAMSKIFARRTCVVIPKDPVALGEGTVLRLRLKHEIQALGAFPLVTQRGAFWFTGDLLWTELLKSPAWERRRLVLMADREAYKDLPATSVPVMQDRPAHLQRETRLFNRGNWLEKGELVSGGVPAFLPLLDGREPADRLELARWLVSKDQPLTARVAVNRFWEQLFGYGIVATLEDFGGAGEKPSHPELLDWLAVHFRDTLKWDVKELLRLIVLSAAYQQDASASVESHELDPQNRLLARGPRRRLKAEMIRDGALAASGLLSRKAYGPPVRPPLPDGVWKPFSRDPWETDEDEDRYRRAIYVYWKRSIPFPSLVTFDAPSRELCQQRRLPSNTPLQALVMFNDAVYVEAAEALAQRMRKGGARLKDQLRIGHRLTTSREPGEERLVEMVGLYNRLLAILASEGMDADERERAALQEVAAVLLNLDETVTK